MNQPDNIGDQHPGSEQLSRFAEGLVENEVEMSGIELHVADCEACARYLSKLAPGAIENSVANWATESKELLPLEAARYNVIEEIGRGGVGIVYKARQAGLDRMLAWKVLISGARAAPSELARFRREAQSLALLDHPHIVKVHDFGEQEGAPFLAMELIDGPTLATRLERGPIEPRLVATWIRNLAQALEYAHQRSIFHRDLKPQNILLARSSTASQINSSSGSTVSSDEDPLNQPSSITDLQFVPKVVDFGLVRFDTDSQFHTKTGETLGTPAYLAPEMIGTQHGDHGNAAVDVYGLGTILYESLTGRPPFVGSSQLEILNAVTSHEPLSIHSLRPSVPRDLTVICQRCLAKNPAQRFFSAANLAADLDRFLEGMPIESRPVSGVERSVRWCRRNPWKALAGSLVGLVLLAIPTAGIYHNVQLRREKLTAQTRYESTRATLWQMLNLLKAEENLAIPKLAELSAQQTEQALALFGELAAADRTPRSQIDLAKVEIQAGSLAIVLGKSSEAESHLKHAVGICRELQRDSDVGNEAWENLAVALNKLAVNLHRTPDHATAVAYLDEALNIHRQLADRTPDDPLRRGNVAWSLMNLGSVWQLQGQLDRAIPLYQEALEIWDSLVNQAVNANETRQSAAGTRINLATIYLGQDKPDVAEEYFRLALETMEQLHVDSPKNNSMIEDLTSGLLNYSNCLHMNGRVDQGVAACSRAKELLLEALTREPNQATLRHNLFLVTANRAHLQGEQRNLTEAAADWQGAVELAPDAAMKTYCRQMRLCCLARIGEIDVARMEFPRIDELKLAPEEKFLQADCWALLAEAHSRNQIATSPDQGGELATAAADHAWKLLMELNDDGLLGDSERREHLQTSADWSALRRFRTPEEWTKLAPMSETDK